MALLVHVVRWVGRGLAAIRMQHGARLLHDTHMTVGEIARHVGYRQPSQFSKAFRRCCGVTPTAFVRPRG